MLLAQGVYLVIMKISSGLRKTDGGKQNPKRQIGKILKDIESTSSLGHKVGAFADLNFFVKA